MAYSKRWVSQFVQFVEDPEAGVVGVTILLRIERGDRIHQLAIGPAFVVKEGLQCLVTHRVLSLVAS